MSKPQAEPVAFEAWKKTMQDEFEGFLKETWAAMDRARDGHWIADTEEVMRSAGDRFRRSAYETLLQLQIEGSEASFFPSDERGEVGE